MQLISPGSKPDTSTAARASRSVGEQAEGGVRPCGEQPGLAGVEGHAQDALVVGHLVPAQDLHRHDQRVGQEVLRGAPSQNCCGA